MTKREIILGRTYAAKVGEKIVPVRIVRNLSYGGWEAINILTGRDVRIKSAQRLRFACHQNDQGKWERS